MLAVAMSMPRINGAQHAAPLQENFAVSEKSSGRLCRANQRFDHGTENDQPVGGVQRGLNRAFRMRHQASHVALPISNSGDVGGCTVRIPGCVMHSIPSSVAKQHMSLFPEVRCATYRA